jgi:hypothetical protein
VKILRVSPADYDKYKKERGFIVITNLDEPIKPYERIMLIDRADRSRKRVVRAYILRNIQEGNGKHSCEVHFEDLK